MRLGNSLFTEVDLFDDRYGTQGSSALSKKLLVGWRFLLEVDKRTLLVLSNAFDLKCPTLILSRIASDNERSLAFRNLRYRTPVVKRVEAAGLYKR